MYIALKKDLSALPLDLLYQSLAEALKVSEEITAHLLKWYARLTLGEKIVKCIKEEGSCWYEAEL